LPCLSSLADCELREVCRVNASSDKENLQSWELLQPEDPLLFFLQALEIQFPSMLLELIAAAQFSSGEVLIFRAAVSGGMESNVVVQGVM
jgi:hypothetical protein